MKVEFKKAFLKDLKKLRDKSLKKSITDCIIQVESAENISQIRGAKKLVGYDVYYRIRLGDYRIGIKYVDEVVYFAALEHRKDIYDKFP